MARRLLVSPGQRFGRLVVTDPEAGYGPGYGRHAGVRCDCGNAKLVALSSLLSGATRSCGCQGSQWAPPSQELRDAARARAEASQGYGWRSHPLYGTWWAMMARCYRPDYRAYHHYGGRGISVWLPWHRVGRFITDIESSIGPRPEGLTGHMRRRPLYTLDRIDNDGDYRPGNLRWATPKEQAANQRPRDSKRGGLQQAAPP